MSPRVLHYNQIIKRSLKVLGKYQKHVKWEANFQSSFQFET